MLFMLSAFCGERGIALSIDHDYEWYSLKQIQVRDRYVKSRFVLILSQHRVKRGRKKSECKWWKEFWKITAAMK